MKKRIWIAACCIALAMTGHAETGKDARKVLDTTASLITGKGGIRADFKADSFAGGQLQGSTSGTMCLWGEKFQMTTPDMTTWYNGETQWSYVKANEEVNVSVPTPEERQGMNPYTFVNLYKSGYHYEMKETTLRGKACYEVTLTAQDKKASLRTVILDIDQKTYVPLCVRMQQGGNGHWTRISIHGFHTGQAFKASDFEFNASDFPQAEVIDLR